MGLDDLIAEPWDDVDLRLGRAHCMALAAYFNKFGFAPTAADAAGRWIMDHDPKWKSCLATAHRRVERADAKVAQRATLSDFVGLAGPRRPDRNEGSPAKEPTMDYQAKITIDGDSSAAIDAIAKVAANLEEVARLLKENVRLLTALPKLVEGSLAMDTKDWTAAE